MDVTWPARFALATLPTPLQRASRLERALGGPPLYVKRDDLTGFALAGNKARKLEFLVADALRQGSDLLLTGGGPPSNHCAATAAAASVAGLACILIYYGEQPIKEHPNLALARAFGAEVRFTCEAERESVDRGLESVVVELQRKGRRPYVIPRGGATAIGALGYAMALQELAGQLADAGVLPETIVLATGSCGTQAGIVAGTAAGNHGWHIVGATVSRPVEECSERVARLARECAAILGWPAAQPRHVDVRDARGPGYGIPSAEGAEAAGIAARTEGLLLDPVYTAKALGLLLSLCRDGLERPVVFWHTGGVGAFLSEGGQG